MHNIPQERLDALLAQVKERAPEAYDDLILLLATIELSDTAMAESLAHLFVWSTTPQGHFYWEAVNYKVGTLCNNS